MDEKVTRLLDHDVITADNLKSAKVFSDGGVLLRQLTMVSDFPFSSLTS